MSRPFVLMAGVAVAATAAVWVVREFLPADKAEPARPPSDRPVATQPAQPMPARLPDLPASNPVVAPTAAAARFKLVGLFANGSVGMALIAVDGKPARAYRQGEVIEGDMVLRQLSARGVVLGSREGGEGLPLEVSGPQARAPAAPSPATTGTDAPQLAGGGSAQPAILAHKHASKYGPIPQPTVAVTQKPAESAAPPVDDGRWRPPGQP